jgi:hypothetical protein
MLCPNRAARGTLRRAMACSGQAHALWVSMIVAIRLTGSLALSLFLLSSGLRNAVVLSGAIVWHYES